jgi:hypothetical protein
MDHREWVQDSAARRQTVAILAKNPGMANPTARGKAGEEFKLLTVTLHFGLLSARRSGDTKAYTDVDSVTGCSRLFPIIHQEHPERCQQVRPRLTFL